jgi:hypothetical protein
MDFASLDITAIQQALAKRQKATYRHCTTADARAYYDGDHWRNGSGWVGPRPDPADLDGARVLIEIARAFVSANKVKEVVGRHMHGVIGREPNWSLTPKRALADDQQPSPEETALIEEATAAITAWADATGIGMLDQIQEIAITLLLAGRASIRLFVPPGHVALQDDGSRAIPDAPDLESALGYLFISLPLPDAAGVITDPDSQNKAGVYLYQPEGKGQQAEVSYVDDQGLTVLAIVDGDTTAGVALDIGRRLWLHALVAPALFTESIRRLQDQLNLALTMQGRNVIQGGFLERIILNGQMPGEWVADTASPGGKRFVPGEAQFGASTTNYVMGAPIRNQLGEVSGYTDPRVSYRDPVPPDTFISSGSDLKHAILEEAQQLHALIAGDATASGESRMQARADFATSLRKTKTALDGAGRWLLETVLAISAHFAGTPGRFEGLRAIFECRIDTGPLSSEEIRLVIEQHAAGLIDIEEAMQRAGVDDPQAMIAKITAEKDANMARAKALMPAVAPPNGKEVLN